MTAPSGLLVQREYSAQRSFLYTNQIVCYVLASHFSQVNLQVPLNRMRSFIILGVTGLLIT